MRFTVVLNILFHSNVIDSNMQNRLKFKINELLLFFNLRMEKFVKTEY